jgi:hypothetical protein
MSPTVSTIEAMAAVQVWVQRPHPTQPVTPYLSLM